MDYNAIQKAIAEKNAALGTRIAATPNIYNQYNAATDPEVMGLRNNQAEKLKQLFAHDTQLADVKFQSQGAPAMPGEIVPQPEERLIDPTIGLRAASAQTQGTASELADILKNIGARKDTLLTERDKALASLNSIIAANKQELSSLEKQMDWYFENEKLKESKSSSSGTTADLQTFFDTLTSAKNLGNPQNVYKQGKTKAKGQKAIEDMKTVYRQIKSSNPDATLDYTKRPDGSYDYMIRGKEQSFIPAGEEPEAYRKNVADQALGFMQTNPKTSSGAENIYNTLFPQTKDDPETERKNAPSDIGADIMDNYTTLKLPEKVIYQRLSYLWKDLLTPSEFKEIFDSLWIEPVGITQ